MSIISYHNIAGAAVAVSCASAPATGINLLADSEFNVVRTTSTLGVAGLSQRFAERGSTFDLSSPLSTDGRLGWNGGHGYARTAVPIGGIDGSGLSYDLGSSTWLTPNAYKYCANGYAFVASDKFIPQVLTLSSECLSINTLKLEVGCCGFFTYMFFWDVTKCPKPGAVVQELHRTLDRITCGGTANPYGGQCCPGDDEWSTHFWEAWRVGSDGKLYNCRNPPVEQAGDEWGLQVVSKGNMGSGLIMANVKYMAGFDPSTWGVCLLNQAGGCWGTLTGSCVPPRSWTAGTMQQTLTSNEWQCCCTNNSGCCKQCPPPFNGSLYQQTDVVVNTYLGTVLSMPFTASCQSTPCGGPGCGQ